MTKLDYFNANNIPCSLKNLCGRGIHGPRPVDITDAVEDSATAEELVDNINKLRLLVYFDIDRETSRYVRLVGYDALGNAHYLRAWF